MPEIGKIHDSKNYKARVGLYFGSFNPIHLGHQTLAKWLVDNEFVDEVWFVVSPCNPLKNHSELLDEYIRLEMLLLAIKEQPRFKASDVEFVMPIPSYSIDTLHELSNQFPNFQFSLIIGSDNALVFDQWKSYQKLLTEYPILVYPRAGYNFLEVIDKYPQMQLLNTPYLNISSSQIRESIAKDKMMAEWLHPAVYKFIVENDLYLK